jgi:DNA primase
MVNKRFAGPAPDVASLVKQAVDIVDVVGQLVALRRVGNRYVGLCPFHQEKTPSFHVDSENQFFHCFGCGQGGDVLSFVMKHQNLAFGDALKYLAERYHIPLPLPEQSQPSAESRKQMEDLHSVLEVATKFFSDQLHQSPSAEVARQYLAKRALPANVVSEQCIGYAPNRWDGLLEHFRKAGIAPQLGLEAGLLVQSAAERFYDRFRHRLIFPITNNRGKTVAFGGRSLDGSEPKYLNSPETALYHKGRMLYNLSHATAACRNQRQVVLVEGYMDLLAFHSLGFYRVTATLGTALTAQQVRLLTRIADEVVLMYDADEAGGKAMLRALPLLLKERIAVTCVNLPEGMDPDDFLRAEGLEGLEKLLRDRQDLGKYAIEKTLHGWDGTLGGKARIITELESIFDSAQQPVLRAEYLRLVAERLGLPEKAVRDQLRQKKGERGSPQPDGSSSSRAHTARSEWQTPTLEESTLRVMIKYPNLIEIAGVSGVLDHFQSEKLRTIAQVLLEMVDTFGEAFQVNQLYDRLPDQELQQLFARLLLEDDYCGNQESAGLYLNDRLGALKQRQMKFERQDLLAAIRLAEQEGNTIKVKELLQQLHNLCLKRP